MTQTSQTDENSSIQGSFNQSLVNTSLSDATIDLAESSIDKLIDNEVVKNIPIAKTLIGAMQAGANIRDRLFLKKIMAFLQNLDDVDVETRRKMINEINDSQKYRLEVGEKLLYIIDNCNDHEISEIIAKLFVAFLYEDISYNEFIIAAEIASRLTINDIEWFLEEYADSIDIGNLYIPLNTGLYMLSYEPLQAQVEDVDDHKALMEGSYSQRINTQGGNIWAEPSRGGKIIYSVLRKDKK